jgi:23S rRNA (cytosine1962-C5)-methyltransferase
MKKVLIKRGCDKRIKKGYLWIFSNEIENIKDFKKGEIVSIYNSKGIFCGTGYINPDSLIAIRILSLKNEEIDSEFFIRRFKDALMLRNKLFNEPFYRLVYSEADYLPGLIIDRFDNTFVLQTNTYGMDLLKTGIESALIKMFDNINIVYKNDSDSRKLEGLEVIIQSNPANFDGSLNIIENDIKIKANAIFGQKTGYFYDQRANRNYLSFLSFNKYVVDTFCYTGAFGLNALKGGAVRVDFVDSSDYAICTSKENVLLNNFTLEKCNFINTNVLYFFKTLKESTDKPDILIVDPPSFVKTKKLLKEGIQGYINLNKWAFLATKKASLIFTFSCSHHVNIDIFKDIIDAAAVSAKRNYTIIAELTQSFDHPIHPQMFETKYLKGYILYIN